MSNRFLWRAVVLPDARPAGSAAGTAGAASKKAPKNATLHMKGKLA